MMTTRQRPRPGGPQAAEPRLPEHPCPCGATHPVSLATDTEIRVNGPTMPVQTPDGAWRIPRVWVAFHGLRPIAKTVAAASQYEWEPVNPF
jgi:hypothetical protein